MRTLNTATFARDHLSYIPQVTSTDITTYALYEGGNDSVINKMFKKSRISIS